MNNWGKYALIAVILTTAGFAHSKNSRGNASYALRDAVADNGKSKGSDTSVPAIKQDKGTMPVQKAEVAVKTGASDTSKGSAAGNDVPACAPTKPVEWVSISGGKFMMGTDSEEAGFEDAKPVHEVVIKTIDMSKTAVTVEQYAECVIKGKCTKPGAGDNCNWEKADRQLHPINCVDWNQADQYAKFKGGRLPSEAEWEYAATGGGKNQKYPWGNEAPTCDKAVMSGNGGFNCANKRTMPVCSKIAGNTAQGLCDMAGNVWQWAQDTYQNSYAAAPADGSAVESKAALRVLRGGAFYDDGAAGLRAQSRNYIGPAFSGVGIGFRLARSSP